MQTPTRTRSRHPRRLLMAGVLALALLTAACAGSDSDTATPTTEATTTAPSTTTARSTTTTVPKPSCAEVQAVIEQLSPADLATLKQWQIMFASRVVGEPDAWLFLAMPTAGSPSTAAYYDWSPSHGLGPARPVTDPGVRSDVQDASVMLFNLMCATPDIGGLGELG